MFTRLFNEINPYTIVQTSPSEQACQSRRLMKVSNEHLVLLCNSKRYYNTD